MFYDHFYLKSAMADCVPMAVDEPKLKRQKLTVTADVNIAPHSDYLTPLEPSKHDNYFPEFRKQIVSLYSSQTHCARAIPDKLPL